MSIEEKTNLEKEYDSGCEQVMTRHILYGLLVVITAVTMVKTYFLLVLYQYWKDAEK